MECNTNHHPPISITHYHHPTQHLPSAPPISSHSLLWVLGTNREQRRAVEKLIAAALGRMSGDLRGTYHSLITMSPAQEQQLIDDHLLFQKPSPRTLITHCGAARDWPDARGVFHNDDKTFLVWVNEEDHLRIIVMEEGGNVKKVFSKFASGVSAVQRSFQYDGYEYMHHQHLGYITCSPCNIGTGMRASVMVRLPKLYKKIGVQAMVELCDSMGLQVRGHKGEYTPAGPNGELDISNKKFIGLSEVQLVQSMIDGVDKLIQMEEACEDDALPRRNSI